MMKGERMSDSKIFDIGELASMQVGLASPETIRSCYVNSLIMERCDISRKP